jgi:selenocysteine lyase/cysteine desulfurase
VFGPLPVQRHLFDIPEDVAYLNCAYMSPQLNAVRDAGHAAIDVQSHPWRVGVPDFFGSSDRARALYADLIGGDVDGVALIPSVSYGVSLAAANLPMAAGQTVVMLAEQFPSNVYPWREAAARAGAEALHAAKPPSGDWTEPVLDLIDGRTAVVAVPQVHWTDGRRLDLVAVGDAAREAGAALVVDATQSVGAAPFDLRAIGPDFLVTAGYKWLMGPYSYGYLWSASRHRAGIPLEYNWIARAGAEDFAGLVDYRDGYQVGARRYDVGERSNFTLAPMAEAALRQLVEWTPERIAATTAAMTGRIEEGALRIGLDPIAAGHREAHLIGVRLPGGAPGDLPEACAKAGVYVSVRGDSVRISPHVYNTTGDVDRLLEVLETAA